MASLSRRACYKCGNVGHYAGMRPMGRFLEGATVSLTNAQRSAHPLNDFATIVSSPSNAPRRAVTCVPTERLTRLLQASNLVRTRIASWSWGGRLGVNKRAQDTSPTAALIHERLKVGHLPGHRTTLRLQLQLALTFGSKAMLSLPGNRPCSG
jgi:hypothetical protein